MSVFEKLEPRILLSADLLPLPDDGAADTPVLDHAPPPAQPAAAESPTPETASTEPLPEDTDPEATGADPLLDSETTSQTEPATAQTTSEPDSSQPGDDQQLLDESTAIEGEEVNSPEETEDITVEESSATGETESSEQTVSSGEPIESPEGTTTPVTEVVFVNDDIENTDQFIEGLGQSHDETNIHVLDSSQDGISQVSDILSEYDQVGGIHFFTHGTEGNVKIGETWLNQESVAEHADQIGSWSDSLADDGDILFYGCDVAATPEDQELLVEIGELTSADIGASADATGHESQGGDWILEYQLGEIETAVPVAAQVQESWQHVLAAGSYADDFDTVTYDNSTGTDLWTTDWTEVGDDADPLAGVIYLDTNRLHIVTAAKTETQRAITREADLGAAASASISFDWETDSTGGQKGYVQLQVRASNVDPWETIGDFEIKADETGTANIAILPADLSSTTEIQFTSTGTDFGGLSKGIDSFYVDNLAINYNTSANTAPVLTPTNPSLPGITEDQVGNGGQAVSTFLTVTDSDPMPLEGIAVTATSVTGGGVWQYSTDNGTTWADIVGAADNNALLLRDSDLVRFDPDGENAATADFDFRAWDQTSGTFGTYADASTNGGTTAFSTATDTASITVSDVNDAPVLTPTSPTLTGLTEDQVGNAGQAVSSFLSSTDVDTGAVEGIAVTATSVTGGGVWQYSTDNGTTWEDIGAVADTNALLLRDNDRVRFEPDGENGATADFDFRGWDQTSGTAGNKVDASSTGDPFAFSTATDTASITVSDVNDAPVLTPTGPTLPGITENDITNGGQAVSSFLSSTDVDTGAVAGIAVTATSVTGGGVWQYSTDNGATWTDIGAVADTSALLLRDNDRVRFEPDGENGATADFDFRGWDQTSGTAGNKVDASSTGDPFAFSTATDTASITVSDVNDPVTASNINYTDPFTEDTALPLRVITVTDPDNPESITATLTLADPSHGSLSTTSGGTYNGATGEWRITDTVANVNAALATLTYNPAANFSQDTHIDVRIEDGLEDGTIAQTGRIDLSVIPVGDTPTVGSTNTDAGVMTGLIAIQPNPSDGPEVTHFRISNITNGSLYQQDGTTVINNNDFITLAEGAAGVRFLPAGGVNGSFGVESSEDGTTVAAQSGVATSNININAPPPPPDPPEEIPEPEVTPPTDETGGEDDPVVEEPEDVTPEPETEVEETLDLAAGLPDPVPSPTEPGGDLPGPEVEASPAEPESTEPGETISPSESAPTAPQLVAQFLSQASLSPISSGNLTVGLMPSGNVFGATLAAFRTFGLTGAFGSESSEFTTGSNTTPDSETLSSALLPADNNLLKLMFRQRLTQDYDFIKDSLDSFREETEQEWAFGRTLVGSAIATSTGLSAGYVIWLLRSGALLSSLLSSLPAWQFTDPLAILAGGRRREDEEQEKDDSLESIVEGKEEDQEDPDDKKRTSSETRSP